MSNAVTQQLEGWGRYQRISGTCVRAESRRDLQDAIASRAGKPVLARGMGRAYGDAALLSSGITLLTERLNRILGFDADTGWLRCEAGLSIDEIIRLFLPSGFFPPLMPCG